MGNRAVITFAPFKATGVGIYVHWNGGRASVEGFLLACKRLEFRSPGVDQSYAMARLTQAITAYFTGGLSVGVGLVKDLDGDNGDNGTYVIGGDWEIVARRHHSGSEEIDPAKTEAIATAITLALADVKTDA